MKLLEVKCGMAITNVFEIAFFLHHLYILIVTIVVSLQLWSFKHVKKIIKPNKSNTVRRKSFFRQNNTAGRKKKHYQKS